MNRAARLALSGVTGALVGYIAIAVPSGYSLLTSFNRKACDDQAPFKVLEARLPTNGNTSYNPKTELCVYRYIDSNGIPDAFAWKP